MTTKASPERVDSTTTGSSTKKRETFDPYRFGRIQFSTQFFRRLISTPLPEVPDEDLLREEDVRASATVSVPEGELSKNALTIPPVRPRLAPRKRRGRPVVLLIGVAVAASSLLVLGVVLVERAKAPVDPPPVASPTRGEAPPRTTAPAKRVGPTPLEVSEEARSPSSSSSSRRDPKPERSPLPKTPDSRKKTTPDPSPPPRGNEAFFEAE